MKKIAAIFLFFLGQILLAQTSLYNGKNPYSSNYSDGETIKINVNGVFQINTSGDWSGNSEVTLKLQPDKSNIPFLSPSEQTRANNRKQSERKKVSQKFQFTLTGILTRQPNGTYAVTANKTIRVDGQITLVNCTGIINDKSIKYGEVNSDDIAELNLVIASKPAIPRDNSFDPPKEADNKEGKPGAFSPEQIRNYVKQYMQEILGALQ